VFVLKKAIMPSQTPDKVHLGNNVFDLKYKVRPRKFRLGLSGTFREFGP